MNDVNHYLSIEKCYLSKILKVTNENNIFIENEKYLFLKIILLCFGELFKNNQVTIIDKQNQENILYFFCEMFTNIIPNLMENYNDIKILTSDTFSSKSTLVNTISDKEILNNNDFYKDAKILIECLYYYIQIILKDILYGKEIYDKIDNYYLKNLTNNEERNKFNQIILILTYNNLINQKNKSEVFIYSLIEYICLKILQDLQLNYIYFYDILIKFYELILDNDDLKIKIMELFSDIFMEEIKLNNFNDSLFLKINEFVFKKNNDKYCEIILPLLFFISGHYINENNENIKIKVLKVLSTILNKNTNKELYYTLQTNTSITNRFYQSDLFNNIFKNFNEFSNKDLENDLELKLEYLNFYITLLLFLNSNFIYKEIGSESKERKSIISSTIFHIYKVELLSINSTDYISYIISLIQFLIYYIKINCISYVNTSYVLFNCISIYYKKFVDINLKNYSYLPFLSYYVIIFILVNIFKIYKIQISLIFIHNNIISNIKNINENYSNLLNVIDINDILSNEYNKELFDKFENNLKKHFTIFNNLNLNKNTFDKIIKIIYTNLFGNISILFSCIEPKIKSSDRIFDDKSNKNESISMAEDFNNSFYIHSLKDEISYLSNLNNIDNKKNNNQEQISINNNENNNDEDILPLNINNISFHFDNSKNTSINQDLEENIKY